MNKQLEIGYLVEVDGEEHYVKYPMDNGIFINEINELVLFTEESKIVEDKEEWTDLEDFSEDERKLIIFFSGGSMKKGIESHIEDSIMAEYTFKKLLKDKFIMRLFPNKNKYISRVEDKKVLKLL